MRALVLLVLVVVVLLLMLGGGGVAGNAGGGDSDADGNGSAGGAAGDGMLKLSVRYRNATNPCGSKHNNNASNPATNKPATAVPQQPATIGSQQQPATNNNLHEEPINTSRTITPPQPHPARRVL